MKKRRKKKKTRWSIFLKPIKVILFMFLIVMVLGCVAGGVVFLKYQDEILACKEKADVIAANTEKADFSQPADTKIYDSSGALIGTINSGHYEYVPISEISENLQNAYIAQEDRRFYQHNGLDYQGLLRAGLVFLKNKGVITQGGSTITQQVIKNTYLTQERTWKRKVTEFFLAPQMEQTYTKQDILEFYCNTNFYANRCYGVAKASRYYFNKEAKALTIWEAATLAGISNNPSRYDPVKHPDTSKEKRDQIIDNMALCKFITKEECESAKAQPLTVTRGSEPAGKENYQTSYAVHAATLELMKNDGFVFRYLFDHQASYDSYMEQYQEAYQTKSDMIRNGGFEIHTSIDSDLQKLLQSAVDERLSKFDEIQENGKFALQGAAVCVDNRTGYIVAIVGGRGTEDEYNRAFLSKRQPGSTIKPLIDYAPAFEGGFYYPSRLVDDHLFENGPKNSGGEYYGLISVREALNRSLNTVAWQVLADIGVDTGMEYLNKMHFTGLSHIDNGNTSMSIGGFTEGARVVDMAKGYSVLAKEGMYSNRSCIISIQSQYDGEVYVQAQADERIFTEDTAYMITDVLRGTLDMPYGTGYGLGLSIPAAGKTGTTNSNKDTWFCGYTRYYTTAVWVGYDTPRAMPGVYGKTYAGRIWHDFMEEINKNLPSDGWKMPSTVSLENVNPMGEKTSEETGRKDLFSSIAEATARSNTKKWQKEEERKKQEEESMAWTAAVEELHAIILECYELEYSDSTTEEAIDRALALMEQLYGTELYEELVPQIEGAINHVMSLPQKAESQTETQEIGPGVKRSSETAVPVIPETISPKTVDEPVIIPDSPDDSPVLVEPKM